MERRGICVVITHYVRRCGVDYVLNLTNNNKYTCQLTTFTMTTYDTTGELFEPEAYDDFRRRDWACYLPYWAVTGASAQEYVDKVETTKRAVRQTVDNKLPCLGFIVDMILDKDGFLE